MSKMDNLTKLIEEIEKPINQIKEIYKLAITVYDEIEEKEGFNKDTVETTCALSEIIKATYKYKGPFDEVFEQLKEALKH